MTLVSKVNTLWRGAREAVARFNRLLAEAEHSDADMIFQIRCAQSERQDSDREPRAPAPAPKSDIPPSGARSDTQNKNVGVLH